MQMIDHFLFKPSRNQQHEDIFDCTQNTTCTSKIYHTNASTFCYQVPKASDYGIDCIKKSPSKSGGIN